MYVLDGHICFVLNSNGNNSVCVKVLICHPCCNTDAPAPPPLNDSSTLPRVSS